MDPNRDKPSSPDDGRRASPARHGWLQRWIPDEERLRNSPTLRWLGPLLRRPWLWQFSRHGVATGIGLGVFFGFLIPFAQIVAAALVALILRANLPVAAVATLISNPLTYAPIWISAYHTGSELLGEAPRPDAERTITEAVEDSDEHAAGEAPPGIGWWERIRSIGRPLFLGLAVFAVVGGTASWLLVHAIWSLTNWLRRRPPPSPGESPPAPADRSAGPR